MKTRNIIIPLLALVLGCTTSCEDFLDTMPDQRAEVNSVKKVKDLLVSAYPTSSPMLMEEMMSDNRMDNGSQYALPANLLIQAYHWQDMTDISQDTPNYMWDGCYLAIAAANQALEAIENLGSPEECLPYKGEALLCRAYAHFLLSNVFCMAYDNNASQYLGIPYITAPETSIGVKYDRGTVKDVYDKINADIEEGLPLINSEAYEVPLYHFNKKAAYAFAAQFNLFYNQFEKAIKYATASIGENPTNLLRNMNGYSQFPSSREYTLAYISKDEPANLMLNGMLSNWGLRYTDGRYGHNRTLCETETIWSKGPWGKELGVYNAVLGYGDQSIFVPKLDGLFETTNAVLGTGYYRQIMFAFTADKTLLNRAEAYVLSKQYDKAAEDLQYWYKVKQATSVPSKEEINSFYETLDPKTNGKPLNPNFDLEDGMQTNFLKAVIHARRIETVHEGERWLDIKRFGIEITHNLYGEEPLVLTAHDLRKAIQLPEAVLAAGLERNPR